MRAGQVLVELMVPAIQRLETQAKNNIFDQLRQDPTYRKDTRNRWDPSESVEVSHLSSWQPTGPARYTRVRFGPAGSSFHLSPCGRCSLPSWQQPCPWCGFYPMSHSDYQKHPQTREDFLRRLQGSTGQARSFFYFYAQQIAGNHVPEWAPIAKRILAEMISLGEPYQWPTHEEVWDYFAKGGFSRPLPSPPYVAPPTPPKEKDDGPAYRHR